MPRRDIIVFVEEPSASEIARAVAAKLGLLERVTILKHQGAGDLERSFGNKIANDPIEGAKFLILRDADNQDCQGLKHRLSELVPSNKRERTIVRIVCQELEAWYLAQPAALAKAGSLASEIPRSRLRGNVDALADPKRLFLRHAHNRGQIEHARRIGPLLDIESTRSASFGHFVSGLRKLAAMQ
ncbi:MAG: DUF4276 family protein [Roseiarcus sp.]|jgi:uncharacterized protein DUF4276